MLRQSAVNDVLVDLDTEGMRDLLRDAHATNLWVAQLNLDDWGCEFSRKSLRTELAPMRGVPRSRAD